MIIQLEKATRRALDAEAPARGRRPHLAIGAVSGHRNPGRPANIAGRLVTANREPSRGLGVWAAVVVAAALATPARAQHYVAGADTAFPRIRYADSLVSPNDRCMVRQSKLNPKVRPVYVNGLPMGFC